MMIDEITLRKQFHTELETHLCLYYILVYMFILLFAVCFTFKPVIFTLLSAVCFTFKLVTSDFEDRGEDRGVSCGYISTNHLNLLAHSQ